MIRAMSKVHPQNRPLNFWRSPDPLLVLAPMAGVTDAAFRRIIAKYGKPDVTYTQFVSCDGLCSPGRDALLPDLWFHHNERPIVAQFHGANPDTFYHSARLAVELGFDGVDINMGCPDKTVLKHSSGAALIRDPGRAVEILAATKDGAAGRPVSVKTRLGFDRIEVESWLPHLLEAGVDALIIHLRTRDEMSKVPAHWEYMDDIVKMARAHDTPLIANGDVGGREEALAKAERYRLDGVMLARAVLGNPWCLNPVIDKADMSLEAVLGVMLEHAQLFEDFYGNIRPFKIMRRHFAAYVSGFRRIKRLRAQLVGSGSLDEARQHVRQALKQIEQVGVAGP